ncbi:MAG: PAS domain S-box protein [Burkholderiaceae bacterium]|nr:PAS domain S-box protein [Burkholderiaceae bacterium]
MVELFFSSGLVRWALLWQQQHPRLSALMAAVAVSGFAAALALAIKLALRYRQMLQESQRNESRLQSVMETAVDGIIMIDAQGLVQSYNAAAQRILGWTAQEVLGRNVNMFIPEPHQNAHDGYLRRYCASGNSGISAAGREMEALHKDGTLVPVRLAVGRVQLPGPALFVGFVTDISLRRKMESALQRSEEQFRSLISNIPGVTFRCRYDRDWTTLFISDAVEALTGWSARDFVEGRVTFTQITHGSDIHRLWDEVSLALQQGRSYQVEYRLRHRNGATLWICERGRGVRGEQGQILWIDGVIVDNTETKARNAEFEGTVRAIGRALAVVEFDLQGRVVEANANFLQLTGYQLAEIKGRHHRLFCTAEYAQDPAYADLAARLMRGERDAGEYLCLGKEGRKVWIQASYNPIFDAEGQLIKIVLFATDLSQRHAMEQELRCAKERAELAAAARSMFLANMSHEIRTPMNAIIGFTEALLESPLDASQRHQLGTVQQASHSMLRLLNSILDTAKLEKAAVELEPEDFSLRELCGQILASLRITASKKGLFLLLEYPSEVPDYLHGDAMRLQQVLVNLLGNAIKFTEAGGVTLRVAYASGEWLLEVQDTGIGIAPEHLERIFDPFAQADATTTRRFGGTGLGTTISRQLTELMGGRIGVQSVLGQGSTFRVCLPLPVAAAPAKGPQMVAQALPSAGAGAPASVPPAIDWEQGVRLWMRLELLCHAVERFCDESQTLAATQLALLDAADWSGLSASAQRLGLAAHNLALVPLHALAQRLERAAHAGDAASGRLWIAQVSVALQEALQAVQSCRACGAPPATAAAASMLLDAPCQATALAALELLAQALAAGELSESPLHTLACILPALLLEPLQQAIDHFDFDQALDCVEALRTQLAPAPEEVAP